MKTGIYVISALLASFLYAIVPAISALITGDQVGDHDGIIAIIIFWGAVVFYMILSVPIAVIMRRKKIKGKWAKASAVVCIVLTPVFINHFVETMLSSSSFMVFLLFVLLILSFASFYHVIAQSLLSVHAFLKPEDLKTDD
ncbi:MAG: hypothetical protein GY755_17685 [Chloroflexi bacterium]|nr:hypothetical protein [Chloroflexota bacterium]